MVASTLRWRGGGSTQNVAHPGLQPLTLVLSPFKKRRGGDVLRANHSRAANEAKELLSKNDTVRKPSVGRVTPVRAAAWIPMARRAEDCPAYHLVDEFQFNWNIDVAFAVCVSQKFVDGSAPNLTVVASKFIHVHTDEFTGEIRAHAPRVCKRMAHYLVAVRQAEIDAFANNFTDIVPDRCGNIFT